LTDEYDGVLIEGSEEIIIEDVEVINSGKSNIKINGMDSPDDQSIEIRDSFISNAGNSGIEIKGGRGDDSIVLENVEVYDSSSRGIRIGDDNSVESVRIENSDIEGSGNDGIDATLARTGIFELIGGELSENDPDATFSSMIDGNGVLVRGGEEILFEDVEVIDSGKSNIEVLPENVENQSISLENVTLIGSAVDDGLRTENSRNGSEIIIRNSASQDNSNYGYNIGGETVQIINSSASGNRDGSLNLQDIDEDEAEIENSF